jgi:hypothetical protein
VQVLVTRVSVDEPICGKNVMLTAEKKPSGKVAIIVESDCEHLQRLNENLKEVGMEDACRSFDQNLLYISARESKLHPTCLVPCAIVNAVWVELGPLSRSMTQNVSMRESKFRFI